MNNSPITPISPLWDTMPIIPAQTEDNRAAAGGAFFDIFGAVIDNVRKTDREKTQQQYLLSTGQLDNPTDLMIAGSKYQMSVDLLVQLRSKALDAYNELNRMSL